MKSHVAAATVSPQDQWIELTFASPRLLLRRPIFWPPWLLQQRHSRINGPMASTDICIIACYAPAAVPATGTGCPCYQKKARFPLLPFLFPLLPVPVFITTLNPQASGERFVNGGALRLWDITTFSAYGGSVLCVKSCVEPRLSQCRHQLTWLHTAPNTVSTAAVFSCRPYRHPN